MLQALSTCAINHETTGAAVVAWVFMGIFAALIVGDAVATGFALAHAINRDAKVLKQTVQQGEALAQKPAARTAQRRTVTSAHYGF
jgi:hypothetical protein